MYDRPKGNFSYLIGFAKQLAQAVETHRDDDVGYACESIQASLALLDALCGESAGDDDGGDDEGIDSGDAPGADTPLGAALARIAELERGQPADVVQSRRAVGGRTDAAGGVGASGERRVHPILTRGRKGAKRRGKK